MLQLINITPIHTDTQVNSISRKLDKSNSHAQPVVSDLSSSPMYVSQFIKLYNYNYKLNFFATGNLYNMLLCPIQCYLLEYKSSYINIYSYLLSGYKHSFPSYQ